MSNKSADDVIDRMQVALNVKSDNELCRELKVGRSTLGGWRSRDSVPYSLCVILSETKNISLEWLLTGKGYMQKEKLSPAQNSIALDNDRLTLAIETVEEGLQATQRTMLPDKKAQLVMAVYDLFNDDQSPAMKQTVLRLVQSANA